MTDSPVTDRSNRCEPRAESGFSLVELVIVMSILMLVIGVLLGVMDSMTKSERRTSGRIDDEQSVRFSMIAITRDLRAANPILPPTTPPGPHNQIDLCLGKSASGTPCGAGQVQVRWLYDPVAKTLTRTVVAGGPPLTQILNGVINGSTSPFLFTWFGHAQGLTSAPDISLSDLPVDLSNCVVTISVTIVSGAHPPTPPITQSAEAGVRNQGGGAGCA